MVLGTAQVRAAPSPVQVALRKTLRGRRVVLWRANESPNLIAALAFRKGSHPGRFQRVIGSRSSKNDLLSGEGSNLMTYRSPSTRNSAFHMYVCI